jgi:hypothetical protein
MFPPSFPSCNHSCEVIASKKQKVTIANLLDETLQVSQQRNSHQQPWDEELLGPWKH